MSYYSDLDEDRADEADAMRAVRERRRPRAARVRRPVAQHHFPATDAEAKALIERLDHFEWETHKVSGRYTAAPYSLSAVVGGRPQVIHLPGRFGTTLTWLKERVEEKEVTA